MRTVVTGSQSASLLEGETYRQEVLTTGAERTLASAEVRHEADDYSLGAGARHVADTGLDAATPSRSTRS